MICDRIWRNCYFKHVDIPMGWRCADADVVKPPVQDLFWIECSLKEVKRIMIPLIRDEKHLKLVESAVAHATEETLGLNFLCTRWGSFVQYYPFMKFSVPGSAWEKITSIKFHDFGEFESLYPRSSSWNTSPTTVSYRRIPSGVP